MEFITQKICMGKDLGVHGNLFGGNMLAWIDEAAGTLASEICRSPNMVTLKIDEVIFKKAVKVGFLIKIYGEVVRMGNTSLTMKIEARKYNVISEEETIVCSTKMTFVRIDESGEPVPIPMMVKEKYEEKLNKS
ncbi:hotdog domain-containing protein [Salibacter sp.]|jgi:acyl-CoA thioesterase YciA|uniref:acyl-CoA thioesterase n=2 Tax=Salibacter sp. TaxID=2010995 RepID=UPI0028706FDF|nr:hotdog domain-containing protein [Salibacter sp.]MDR9488659.1 hotdog domain-containing protein [Salibacter sp.]